MFISVYDFFCKVQKINDQVLTTITASVGRGTNEAKSLFLSHSSEYGFECAGVFRSYGVSKVQFGYHQPLPDLPHPPTLYVFFEVVT